MKLNQKGKRRNPVIKHRIKNNILPCPNFVPSGSMGQCRMKWKDANNCDVTDKR